MMERALADSEIVLVRTRMWVEDARLSLVKSKIMTKD